MVLCGAMTVGLGISVCSGQMAPKSVFLSRLPRIPVVGDWRAPRFCDVMNGEPVPANWFHRVGIGIRRPTCSREGTLRGAFAACGHRSPVLAALTDHVHGWRCPSVEWLLAPLE